MENITHIRGDTLSFGVELENCDQDLDSAYFSVKKDPDDADYILRVQLGSGISKVGETENKRHYAVRVPPEMTENLEPGTYHYDMEIGINGDYFTILRGLLTLLQDITRRDVDYV